MPPLLGEWMTSSRRLAALLASGTAILLGSGALPGSAAAAGGGCAGAGLIPTAANTATVRAATLCLINAVRARVHVRSLRVNASLQAVAASEVQGMIRHDYFADVAPSGETPGALIHATGYAARGNLFTGEDIGLGTGSAATPAVIVRAWLNSPEHRAIMLDGRYRDIGVGVVAAVPAFMGRRARGATYAIELGARLP